MSLAVDISMAGEDWLVLPDRDTIIETAVAAAAEEAAVKLAAGAEVSVMLCDDATIRGLNRDWRGFDKPTNVLSFPASGPETLDRAPLLGDIVVAYQTTAREARDEGKSIRDHMTHLVVHGFLHLLGHDHMEAEDADRMEALETRILRRLGIADPHIADSHADRALPRTGFPAS